MIKRKILVILLALTLIFGSFSFASAAPSTFPDLSGYGWAEDYIDTMVLKGGMEGYPDGKFKPGNNITVAEFVKTTVALVDGEKEKAGLLSHWATNYMNAAIELQITPEGMFERADWNKPITREKMAVIMERTAQLILKEDKFSDASTNMFKDRNEICSYCDEYLAQAVSRGLINGLESDRFGPQEPANRAHAATMLTRLVEPIYRLTLTEDDIDEIMGLIEKGDSAYDFAKGVELDIGFKDYDYVVYDSTDLLMMTIVDKYTTSTEFYVRYFSHFPLYIFDKAGNRLARSVIIRESGNNSWEFEHPLSSVEYFAILNYDLDRWEFYLNDLLTPEKAYLLK